MTSPSDPSSADTTAGFKYAFACDGLDASLPTTYAAAGTSTTQSCLFDDNGSFTVKGRIFDKDNGFTTYQATVVVNNVAPTATFAATSPINEGGNSTLSLTSPSDPSTADTTAGFNTIRLRRTGRLPGVDLCRGRNGHHRLVLLR